MSRGPGRLQRDLLRALSNRRPGWYSVRELTVGYEFAYMRGDAKRSTMAAARRAARSLAVRGYVEVRMADGRYPLTYQDEDKIASSLIHLDPRDVPYYEQQLRAEITADKARIPLVLLLRLTKVGSDLLADNDYYGG